VVGTYPTRIYRMKTVFALFAPGRNGYRGAFRWHVDSLASDQMPLQVQRQIPRDPSEATQTYRGGSPEECQALGPLLA
jgi:hypothetical protein